MSIQKSERLHPLSLPLSLDASLCLAWAESVLGDIHSALSNESTAGAIAVLSSAAGELLSAKRANAEELASSADIGYRTPTESADVGLGNDQETGDHLGGGWEELRRREGRAAANRRAADELTRATKTASKTAAKKRKARRRRGSRRRVRR